MFLQNKPLSIMMGCNRCNNVFIQFGKSNHLLIGISSSDSRSLIERISLCHLPCNTTRLSHGAGMFAREPRLARGVCRLGISPFKNQTSRLSSLARFTNSRASSSTLYASWIYINLMDFKLQSSSPVDLLLPSTMLPAISSDTSMM